MIYLDTETIGFDGPAVLIQYSRGQHEPALYYVWDEPVRDTLALIEEFTQSTICAFNLTFDWFHIQQLYCMFSLADDKSKPPNPYEIREKEAQARLSNICIKPKGALDLMLVVRKGEFQITMERKSVLIRNVPKECADVLVAELNRNIDLNSISFIHKPHNWGGWETVDSNRDGFLHLRLRYFPSGSLKAIINHIDNTPTLELNAPYDHTKTWLQQLHYHQQYWKNNAKAIQYARNDVLYLHRLYNHFGYPSPDSLDDQLAICVACCKYRGYALDIPRIQELLEAEQAVPALPFNPSSPKETLRELHKVCNPLEREAIRDTSKATLEELQHWEGPIGILAKRITEARHRLKRIHLYKRLTSVGRFYPDFKIIGARSGRMSGGGVNEGTQRGRSLLNPQGIQRDQGIRSCFTLRDNHLPVLAGGDFAAFEPTIQDAVYNDPQLRADLEGGAKLYDLLIGLIDPTHVDYIRKKFATLGFTYGAMAPKVAEILDLPQEQVEAGYRLIAQRYPKMTECRAEIAAQFCSMQQPGGLGTEVVWHEPSDYIETLFGFRRYFTVENQVARHLFDLTKKLPKMPEGMCIRRQREQTLRGACCSALYAAAFNIQAQNMRAANNHVIQGSGAHICKDLQASLWNLQPVGIHAWVVAPFNIHDEVQCPTTVPETTQEVVRGIVEKYKGRIPLIKLDWRTDLENWGDK